jgi:hypothetical protein
MPLAGRQIERTLTPDLQKLAERWVVRTAAGNPVTESWTHEHFGADPWSSYFGYSEYLMCCAVQEYQEFAIQNIVGVLDKGGYSAMFFDQAVESLLCFSKEQQSFDGIRPVYSQPRLLGNP